MLKNWSDHPWIVGIGVVAALFTIITGCMGVYRFAVDWGWIEGPREANGAPSVTQEPTQVATQTVVAAGNQEGSQLEVETVMATRELPTAEPSEQVTMPGDEESEPTADIAEPSKGEDEDDLPTAEAKSVALPEGQTKPATPFGPSKVVEDCRRDEMDGLCIYLDFHAYNLEGVQCAVVVFFYDEQWVPLEDLNGRWANDNGNVRALEFFTPSAESVLYENFELFMPYDELHLDSGKHDLILGQASYRREGWQDLSEGEGIAYAVNR